MTEPNSVRKLAHYELLGEIGRGGMGVVYEALDTRLQRPVAIKVLPAPVADVPGQRARLLREARAAAQLNHPAIATVYEVGEAQTGDPEIGGSAENVIYIAMERVRGDDLAWRIEEGLGVEEGVDYAVQIADALVTAHRQGVIHRDLKPRNVRITPDGRVKILDFGLAKMAPSPDAPSETALTASGAVVGTIPYMAPEQFEGAGPDARSDLFSFGVMLYQMFTGQLPFGGGSLVDYVRDLARKKPESVSKLNPQIPARLAGLVERLLAKDPEDRYPSAVVVCDELKAIARGDSGSLSSLTTLRPLRRLPARQKRRLAAGVLAGVLAVAAVMIYRAVRAPSPVENLAVLPFENRTDDPALDAYYEGVGSTLIHKLSGVRGLNVVSELDVKRYRGTEKTSAEIARELDVGTLVQGYVQGNAERIRAVVEVRNAVPSVSVWKGEVEGSPKDLLTLEEQLADEVIRNLPVSLSARERERLRRNPTRSQEAYAAYSLADVALGDVADTTSAERAVELFQEALKADPDFSWAYVGLARALVRRYDDVRKPELLEEAARAAARAVELEPDLPEPRIARALVLRRSGRLGEAVADLEAVVERHPELDVAHLELAKSQWERDELLLAEKSYRRALEIRPLSWRNRHLLGSFYMETGRYAEAREQLEKAAELAPPEVVLPLENLGSLEWFQGHLEAALATYERIPKSFRTPSLLASIGTLDFVLGRLDDAESSFRRAIELQPEEPLHYLNLGDTELYRGSEEEARETYAEGVRHLEAQLLLNPESMRLRVLRPVLLAKAGECERSTAMAENLKDQIAGRLEDLLFVAKTFAVCRKRDLTLETLRELVAGGMPAERLREEFEFEWLKGDPELDKLFQGGAS